jgi:hypothetical protein
VIRQEHRKEGTAMGKQYQTSAAEASTPGLTIPDEVSVALAEIAESAKEGLLALAVGAGLQVLGTMMEESVTQLAGPKGKHTPDRTAVRHGHEQGSVTLGGRTTLLTVPHIPGEGQASPDWRYKASPDQRRSRGRAYPDDRRWGGRTARGDSSWDR